MDMVFAQQCLFITLFIVGVFLDTAEGLILFGNSRKDQHVCGAEHDQAHHSAYDPLPYFFAFFTFQLYQNIKIELLLHMDPSFLK
jgi:hypothetical protein